MSGYYGIDPSVGPRDTDEEEEEDENMTDQRFEELLAKWNWTNKPHPYILQTARRWIGNYGFLAGNLAAQELRAIIAHIRALEANKCGGAK